MVQSRVRLPIRLVRNLRNHGGDNFFRRVRVAMQIVQNHLDGDVFLFLPAIVVRRHRHRRVGDLGLARALGLAEIRHADDIVTRAVVRQRLRARAERRAFHADISAAVVDTGFLRAGCLQNNFPQLLADRRRKRDVSHDAAPEKSVVQRLLRAVEKLVDQDDVARAVFFLQRADGADADDPLHAEFFHRPDVRAMVQLRGQQAMAATVARQKHHVAPGDLAGEQIVRRAAERRPDLHPFLICETFDVVKSRAADDADFVFCHAGFFTTKDTKDTK